MERIIVYNKNKEKHEGSNVFDISETSVFFNPFTFDKTNKKKGKFHVRDLEEGLKMYEDLFDANYIYNPLFIKVFDKMYEEYCTNGNIYLGMDKLNEKQFDYSIIIKKKLVYRSLKNKVDVLTETI